MDSKKIKINASLPEETIEDILSRLPVKSLVKFRCVSKSWLSLISSEGFIEAHRQNSTKNRGFFQHKVMFECREGGVFKQCSVQKLLNEASSIKPCRVHDPTNNELLRGAFIVGCCNGLLCLFNYQRVGLFLWNPATMIFKELPMLNGLGITKFGFGWDGRSGAYKVFVLSHHGGISKGNVYSSRTNSWKTVDRGCLLPEYDITGVFAGGKIHWLERSEDYYYIESFDLESEEFGKIELPSTYTNKEQLRLAEIGGCLHLLRVDVHDQQSYLVVVWVMKEESGWLKLFTFPPIFFNTIYFPMRPLFGGGPNGEIFLLIRNKFLFYDGKDVIVLPASKDIMFFKQGRVYVESLVSPNLTTPS